MKHERSQQLFAKAKQIIPGGVNSPVRAFKAVGIDPIFITKGIGPYLHDVDGNRYIDYICSWGPLILGHAAPDVVQAIQTTAAYGTSFGATTPLESQLAQLVINRVPSIEKIRFVSSGTEATMSALRLARGATGRDKLIKFAGCYHGHADPFLTDAGSGVATLGIPGCAGIPHAVAADTVTLPYNDIDAVTEMMQHIGHGVAAIIVEPVACNMGLVQPIPGFLEQLRALCDTYQALLIFDEVITGFRVHAGGAQALFNIKPDITTFGKIIGGGLPVGAYGGSAWLMDHIAPNGPVYQAGTLSGNPLAMAAGIATLQALMQHGFYDALEKKAAYFQTHMQALLSKHAYPARFDRVGSIFYLWFHNETSKPPRHYQDIKQSNQQNFVNYFQTLFAAGILMSPSAYEVGFISAAHTYEHLDATLSVIDGALSL